MCDKWGVSKDYHKVRSKCAVKHFEEVDGNRIRLDRWMLRKRTLKFEFSYQ